MIENLKKLIRSYTEARDHFQGSPPVWHRPYVEYKTTLLEFVYLNWDKLYDIILIVAFPDMDITDAKDTFLSASSVFQNAIVLQTLARLTEDDYGKLDI